MKVELLTSDLYLKQAEKIKVHLRDLDSEKASLNRRLDFLLDGASETEIQDFKREYKATAEKINSAIKQKQPKSADNFF